MERNGSLTGVSAFIGRLQHDNILHSVCFLFFSPLSAGTFLVHVCSWVSLKAHWPFCMLQEREERHGYEAEQIAREEALADCQRRESQEETAAQTEQESAEMQLAFKKDQLKRAMALPTEPEKGPDVSQVYAKC